MCVKNKKHIVLYILKRDENVVLEKNINNVVEKMHKQSENSILIKLRIGSDFYEMFTDH